MSKRGMTIKVKTPTRAWKTKDVFEFNKKYKEDIENNVSKVCLNKIENDVTELAINNILLFATFFQRVVSRTPLDEDYTWVEEDENGNKITRKHKADEIQCRYDWYIENDYKKMYARDFLSEGVDFKYINNQSDINKIASILEVNFDFYDQEKLKRISIGNDNPHFAILEYGGGRNWGNNGEIKKGKGNLYEHGVENNHSVQAPVGMKRITEAELARDTRTKRDVSKYIEGNKRGMRRNYSDKDLKEFYKIIRHGRFKYADIKRYLNRK